MAYEYNTSSSTDSRFTQQHPASKWSSSSESRDTKPSNTMLSINFSTPLAGAARSERIKQMTNNHPAFEKSRMSQEILVKIQTSLRRMPGVSSKESNEIVAQLQEVGQIVSTETSQLVDALMNLTLDQEDTDKAIARMSIEANLAKAEADDQAHNMSNLRVELANEKTKRQEAESEVVKVMDELQKLSREFKSLKGGDHDGSPDSCVPSPDRDDMIKQLEDTIKHLEDQVNSRRSLWVMKNPSPSSVARAIETIAEACPDKGAVQKSILSLRPDGHEETNSRDTKPASFNEVAAQSQRPASTFQSSRPPSTLPTRFGSHIVPAPPRPSSTAPSERRFGQWAPPTPVQSQSRFGPPPATGTGPQSMFGRNTPRRGLSSSNYRPNAPEFYPQSYGHPDKNSPAKSNSGFNQQRREYYPPTPSNSRNKYSRFRDVITTPDYTAPPGVLTTRPPFPGPPIHVTDMTITAWHDQLMDMYAAVRRFVNEYASEPTFVNPTDLSSTRLWPVLLAAYHPLSEPEAISYLDFHLKEDSSKCCLVTRVMVDYIVNRVWVPRAWMGAEKDATYGLIDVEKEFEKTQGQPAARRQYILDRQASIIDSILKLDSFEEFSKLRCREISEVVLHMVEPLINPKADPEELWEELEGVSGAAWALSSRILSSRLTFDFRFPEIGSRYSFQSMLPIWPDVEPAELQSDHWRVALVTTPVVTVRNDTGANISAHSVCVADVVCMR
ncbi:chromosome segregation smc [Fusarium heterosporum]|uniref:Chromosome segregation smc n=1 Tax=Fusarium heterosporum TaxID=42747 RepID=A0A8H5TYG1_FUSHE|nr:chromosome segregation smc [Fusarium heterosporum]